MGDEDGAVEAGRRRDDRGEQRRADEPAGVPRRLDTSDPPAETTDRLTEELTKLFL